MHFELLFEKSFRSKYGSHKPINPTRRCSENKPVIVAGGCLRQDLTQQHILKLRERWCRLH